MPGHRLLQAARRAFDGDLAVFGGPDIVPGLAGRVRAAQIEVVHRYTPWMMVACITNACVLVGAMAQTPKFLLALVWAGFVCPAAAVIYVRWWSARNAPPRSSVSPRAVHRTVVNAAIYGLAWGLAPILFFSGGSQTTDLVIVCLCAGMMCGGAVALSTIPVAALVATAGISAGAAFAFLRAGDGLHVLVGVLLVSYTAVLVKSSLSHANVFAARMLGHIQGEQQREVIGMLLCEFEESASDWLWEIDASQRMVHVSARLAALMHCPMDALVGKPFTEVIAPCADAFENMMNKERVELIARLHEGSPFRNLAVSVVVRGERRLWSLTGKPVWSVDGVIEGFRGVGTDVTEARAAEEKIRHMARHDALTGLPNRVFFYDDLETALARLKRSNEAFAVHCLDLDHMKEVNDSLGHASGDAMLVAVATRLRSLMTEKDTFARVGGDEFAIIQAGAASAEDASILAANIVQCLAGPLVVNGASIALGASIGIAMAPSDGTDADTLLKNADLALYRTKHTGRGAFHFFEPEMNARARARRQLEADLRKALQGNEFQLHYQPLIDVSSGRISGCEALLRWQHPQRGLVMPADFIPLAEETGLIVAIGAWVIRQACWQAVTWPDDIRVAVNLSAVQFRSPGLLAVIRAALAETGLDARRLEVEVTESVLISEKETAEAILGALRLLGVRTALDDFGTGYSSLSYLRQMPFDKIKIDRSFINDLMTQPDCAAIVHALIGLAGSLRMSITAEGVETHEQLTHLREKGCGEAQGFLIGRPGPAAQFAALINAQSGTGGSAAERAAA